MEIRVEVTRDLDEFKRAVGAIVHYFGFEQRQEGTERFMKLLGADRMYAAWSGDQIVGGTGSFAFELTVPVGATVRCGGVTVVGVLPTHRRRGVLTAMMRAQLDELHRVGEPLALLWAAEAPIYPRFGYGMASLAGDIEIARERGQFALPLEQRGSVRLVSAEEALETIPPVYDRVRRQTPGMYVRSRDWWELRQLRDPAEDRQGAGPQVRAVVDIDGVPQGYALYRIKGGWEGGINTGTLNVIEAFGATPRATAEIWRFLLDIDWIAKLKASLLPPDHPLFFLLAEPRRMGYRVGDALWCRLVDVGAALSARSYATDAPVVIDVRDAFCPWNEGVWRVAGGHAARTRESPGMRLDVRDLGSVYLGGFTFGELIRAGRVEELTEGAAACADAVFAADRHPWCPEIF